MSDTPEVPARGESPLGVDGNLRPIYIVEKPAADDIVLMTFNDPSRCYAVVRAASSADQHESPDRPGCTRFDVLLVPASGALPAAQSAVKDRSVGRLEGRMDSQSPVPVSIKYRGVELTWNVDMTVLRCDADLVDSLLLAVIDFTYYERQLRFIEEEIANGWTDLERDKLLAYEVTTADLERSEIVGGRMNQAFQRRIRHARIEPHLYEPAVGLSASGKKLGEELREAARIESRLEIVDGQLEVFEYVYEMASQRLGEFRASRSEHTLEWIIIVLLAGEALMMLADLLWKVGE